MPRRLPSLLAAVAPPADGRSDAELLARFLAARDEAAFEALVWRHGPAVRAVCRAVLGRPADADDAFQATFLVLARKAGSVRRHAAVGGWLLGVAARVARKLRRQRGRHPPTAEDLSMIPDPAGPPDPAADVRAVIDEEIARLPERYRLVVQLCYLAGHTTAEAADRLGRPRGTVLSRLAAARELLRRRLARRGVAPAALVATAAALDPALVRATVRAATAAGAAAVLPAATEATRSLCEGVIRDMALSKLRLVAGTAAVMVAAAGVGAGRWAATAAGPGDGPPAASAPADPPKPPATPKPMPAKPEPVGIPKLDLNAPVAVPLPPPPPSPEVKELRAELNKLRMELETVDEVEKLRAEVRKLKDEIQKKREKWNPPPPPTAPPAGGVPVLAGDLAVGLPPLEFPKAEAPPAVPSSPAPAPEPVRPDVPPPLAAKAPPTPTPAVEVPSLPPQPAGPARKGGFLTGAFHRTAGGHSFHVTFGEGTLSARNRIATPDGAGVTVTIEAEYAVAKDGTVYGYITDGEVEGQADADVTPLAGLPFSFRARADDGSLVIRDVKLGTGDKVPADAVLFVAGRYAGGPEPPVERKAILDRPKPAGPQPPAKDPFRRPDGSNRLIPTPRATEPSPMPGVPGNVSY
jgi:RNA polymerase sigma-70 factor (ECF subfamily)